MVHFEQDPVFKQYVSGKTAIRLWEDGSGFAYYPSGRIAVTVSSTSKGFVQQCFADNKGRSVLCQFNEIGEGSVNWPSGRPRFVCTVEYGQLCTEDGDIENEWQWTVPVGSKKLLNIPEPFGFSLNAMLSFSCTNRQNMGLKLNAEGVLEEFKAGETPKRADTYIDHKVGVEVCGDGLPGGKILLDTPSSDCCNFDGTWKPEPRLEKDDPEQWAANTFKKLNSADLNKSLVGLAAWQVDAAGGYMDVKPYSESLVTTALIESWGEDIDAESGYATGKMSMMGTLGKGDYHNSTIEDRRFNQNSGAYHTSSKNKPTKRRRLPTVSQRALDAFVGEVPKEQLVVVCVLASYQPVDRRMESTLEDVWGELTAAGGVLGKKGAEAREALDKMPHRFVKVCYEEGPMIGRKFKFKATPMFFMYSAGELVFADSTFHNFGSTKIHLKEQLALSVRDAQQGKFLPKDFTFGTGAAKRSGNDKSSKESMLKTMTGTIEQTAARK